MVYLSSAHLDSTFFALADPTRRSILARLASGERSISELASRFDMSLPAVSKHLRVLERAGLASVRREGRVRRCRLTAEPLRDAVQWMERYRRYWEQQLDQLAQYLADFPEPEDATWDPSTRRPTSPSSSSASSTRRARASSAPGRRSKK